MSRRPSTQRTWIGWGAIRVRGFEDHFIEVFVTKQQAIRYVVMRAMGAHDYDRLETDSMRWQHCYRRGWRLVRCTVTTGAPRP